MALMPRRPNRNTVASVRNYFMQDIGMLLFLLVIFTGSVFSAFLTVDKRIEFLLMLLLSFFGILMSAFRFKVFSLALSSIQTIAYTCYKLYMSLALGQPIDPVDFVWVFFPLCSVAAMQLYISRGSRIEEENTEMRRQIEELVLVDPGTGLNNLKSLYLDLTLQVSLATRAHFDLTLMIVSCKYEEEIRKILGKHRYEILRQGIASTVRKLLRTGDRLYAIDDRGTLAAVMICDAQGAEIVRDRVRVALQSESVFPDLLDHHTLKLDFQISVVPYDFEAFGLDMVKFKKKAESELQYDV